MYNVQWDVWDQNVLNQKTLRIRQRIWCYIWIQRALPCYIFLTIWKKIFQQAVLKQSVKRNLVQFTARADNSKADVAAKLNLGWIFIRKKDGINVPALTKHPGNFSVKKDAKNVLLGKSNLCFNQELLKHMLFPLTAWIDSAWTHAFVSSRTDFLVA